MERYVIALCKRGELTEYFVVDLISRRVVWTCFSRRDAKKYIADLYK